MTRTKLTLGKKTIRSIELQVTTILQSLHRGAIEITKTRPHRTNIGNFAWITYRTAIDPELTLSCNFALQRVGDCCDVWLDSLPNQFRRIISGDAA